MTAPPPSHSPPPLPEKSGLPAVDAETLLGMYREMLRIRRIEELAAKAYTQRKILGFCHLYIGQESVAVGTAAASTERDYWMLAAEAKEYGAIDGVLTRRELAAVASD